MAVMTRMISMKEVHSVRSGRSFPKQTGMFDHENSLKDGKASTTPKMNPIEAKYSHRREKGGQSFVIPENPTHAKPFIVFWGRKNK
jgi:hypothetical protein